MSIAGSTLDFDLLEIYRPERKVGRVENHNYLCFIVFPVGEYKAVPGGVVVHNLNIQCRPERRLHTSSLGFRKRCLPSWAAVVPTRAEHVDTLSGNATSRSADERSSVCLSD
jgi:hypothetical protein